MGEFSGIDPKALNGMIGSYKTDKDRLRQGVTGIKSNFERFGIDTQPLTELLAICGWFDDQTPMLTRRYHLAVAAESPYPGAKNMVSVDEAKVGMTAEAQKNGKDLGDKVKKALEDNDAVPADLMAALEQNAGDGDFVKAFYEALGPDHLSWLSNEMADDHPYDGRYKDHPEQRTHDRDLIAKTLGTFTQVAFDGQSEKDKQANWNKWFDTFVMDPNFGFRPDRLLPLLKGGTYDKDFLVALGDRVSSHRQKTNEQQWMGGSGDKNAWTADHYTQLFEAISQNPEASGEWMDHNHDDMQIILYPHGPWDLDNPKSRAAAFVKLAHAGTIDLRLTNEPLAEKNTARLLYDNYMHAKNPDTAKLHPVAGIDGLYSDIIQSYWADLEHSVTSPTGNRMWMSGIKAKGEDARTGETSKWDLKTFLESQNANRRGLETAPQVWQALMQEAVRDPKAAGDLSAIFQAYDLKKITLLNDSHSSAEDRDASNYQAISKGLMQNFYAKTFKAATEDLGMGIEDWAAQTNAFREGIITTGLGLATDAATAGAGTRAAAARDNAVGLGVGTVTDLVSGLLTGLVDVKPSDAPKGMMTQYKDVSGKQLDFTWPTDYQNFGADLLKSGFPESGIRPVTITDRKGNSVSYDGDPAKYFKEPGDNFLDTDGNFVDDMSPQQLEAFNQWLQNPAVVNTIYNHFSAGRNAWTWDGQGQ